MFSTRRGQSELSESVLNGLLKLKLDEDEELLESLMNVFLKLNIDEDEEPEAAIVTEDENGAKWLQHYCSSHKVLLVGEGDFSFSACLAKAFGDATNIVATSLDSYDFVRSHYSKGPGNIDAITDRGGQVIHDMNAKTMASRADIKCTSFDRIVFNFPHAGFAERESRSSQILRHRNLIMLFFLNAKKLLACGGEIHIVHKTNGFFAEWGVEDLAAECGLCLVDKTEFRLKDYPGYGNKYGFGGDRNFDCDPSMTFKFCLPEL